MAEASEGLYLPKPTLLIALLPLAVYLISEWLLYFLGASEIAPTGALHFDAHEEGAGRYRVLATFFLEIAAAVSAIGYFIVCLLRLDRTSQRWALGAFLALVLFVAAFLLVLTAFGGRLVQMQQTVGQRVVCMALSQTAPPASFDLTAPSPGVGRSQETPAARPQRFVRPAHDCATTPAGTNYARLRTLINIASLCITFAIPALAIGSIICLAWSRRELPPAGRMELRSEQIGRLNTFLYLSTFLLVSGLLFLSAFLHWPAFALPPESRDAYRAHVHAVVLFNGVSYSLLIAAYYVPVAGLLARRWRDLALADGERAGENMLSGVGLLKVASAVFAPLIVGLLGEVMTVPVAGL